MKLDEYEQLKNITNSIVVLIEKEIRANSGLNYLGKFNPDSLEVYIDAGAGCSHIEISDWKEQGFEIIIRKKSEKCSI